MYNLMIKLIVAAALLELGIAISSHSSLASRPLLEQVQRASWEVLRVDWKPISMFPEEAAQFKQPARSNN